LRLFKIKISKLIIVAIISRGTASQCSKGSINEVKAVGDGGDGSAKIKRGKHYRRNSHQKYGRMKPASNFANVMLAQSM